MNHTYNAPTNYITRKQKSEINRSTKKMKSTCTHSTKRKSLPRMKKPSHEKFLETTPIRAESNKGDLKTIDKIRKRQSEKKSSINESAPWQANTGIP